MPNYAAKESGIEAGDKILKINNKRVRLKSDIDKFLQGSNGEELKITIDRNNQQQEILIKPTPVEIKSIGIYLGIENENLSSEIKGVYENSPAQNIGLKEGDIIVEIDGNNCENDPYKVVDLINESKKDKIQIKIKRNEEIKTAEVTPKTQTTYKMGVTFKVADNTFNNNVYYGFWDTIDFSTSIIDNLRLLFTGNVSVDQLTGPIGISEAVSKTKGIVEFVYLIALISLSLGVTNLLPFPPLDGGKIVILLIEAIRKKPIKQETETRIQLAGFFLLIFLSIYVAYNDLSRIF